MCFFLTIGIPAEHAARVPAVFGRGFQTSPTLNASVLAAMPRGFSTSLILSGRCSCDLFMEARKSVPADRSKHLRSKYLKLGWSAAKIARAIEQSTVNHRPHNDFPFRGLRGDVVSRLRELSKEAKSVAAIVHWYDDEIETARIPINRHIRCTAESLDESAAAMNPDELLLVVDRPIPVAQ